MTGIKLLFRSFTQLLILCAALLGCLSDGVYADDYASDYDPDWHYTFRPGDTLQSVAEKLLKPSFHWSEISHYNNLKAGVQIEPGSVLKVPIDWLRSQPQPAQIKSFEGAAMLKRSRDTRFRSISQQEKLFVGDELLTREGRIEVVFADDSTLSLTPYSHLVFNKLSNYGGIGMVDTRMRLDKGGLKTRVAPLGRGSRYEISTPSAVAAVRGTEFRLRTNEQGTTLEVLRGEVEFRHAHGAETISAGRGARTTTQSALLERVNLNSMPRTPVAGASGSSAQSEDRLAWQGLPAEYSVNQASDNDVEAPVPAAITPNNPPIANEPDGSADRARLLEPIAGSIINSMTGAFSWAVEEEGTLSRLELSRDSDFEDLAIPTSWSESTEFAPEQKLPPGDYYWRVRTMSPGEIESVSSSRAIAIQGMLDPVNILTVNYIGNQVGIFWHSVDNAKGYVLQVSDDKEFRRLLKEETMSKTKAFLKLPQDKVFYARVKGLGDEVYSSEYGPLKEIFLGQETE